MMQRSSLELFLPSRKSLVRTLIAGAAAAALTVGGSGIMYAQTADQAAPAAASADKPGKKEKVVQTKDTKQALKKEKKDKVNQLAGMDASLPDKALYDKAEAAVKRGHYDVGRLDLQTLLNTYPDSQYQMRAKLAIADAWYKEGGSAALTQAEQEYKDFITFFPNAPEAAEAQMRVGDIYFKQMDKPDRDYTKTKAAEQEYRLMLQQFPDSPLVPQAKQRLREVQETLANRETSIAEFYASHNNTPASIARYQTVIDTYPLYSRIDEVLIGVGDAYAEQAKIIRAYKLPEDAKARLEKIYDDQAAAAYRKVVTEHSAAPHAEDAKDRLAAMNLPIPTPTPEQAAESAALENSRGQYTLSKRANLLFLRKADTVPAASVGDPPLEDAKPTLAPTLVRDARDSFQRALDPNAPAREGTPLPAESAAAGSTAAPAAAATPAAASFQDVPQVDSVNAAQPSNSAPAAGAAMGVEIVSPSADSSAGASRGVNGAPPAFPGSTPATSPTPAAATPSATSSAVPDPMAPVGPPVVAPLAPIQKSETAPDAVNEAKPGAQGAVAQTAPANGKKEKPAYFKDTESSSKKKPKKGVGKLNPF